MYQMISYVLVLPVLLFASRIRNKAVIYEHVIEKLESLAYLGTGHLTYGEIVEISEQHLWINQAMVDVRHYFNSNDYEDSDIDWKIETTQSFSQIQSLSSTKVFTKLECLENN